MIRILFVCSGNICRSPTAEGVLRKRVQDAGLARWIEVSSAGTHDYHVGEPPDPRAIAAARRRNYDLTRIRARRVDRRDLEDFDYVLAMDGQHLDDLRSLSSNGHKEKPKLFMSFAAQTPRLDVPDPYYGGADGFELVLDLVERASEGLLEELKRDLETRGIAVA